MTVSTWLHGRRSTSPTEVSPLAWELNREWVFNDGVLCHRTRGFFSIVGAQFQAPTTAIHGLEMPMIHQPEVGLLGFIVCAAQDGVHWLLQAKNEPGSVHFIQGGPTVQATESNYRRLHGGLPTRYLDLFCDPTRPALADTRQSEHGSRFVRKFNRNAVQLIAARFDCPHPDWAWFPAEELKRALGEDFLINTDARSVIACAPWHLLCPNGAPFAPGWVTHEDRSVADFVAAARESYQASSAGTAAILSRLKAVDPGTCATIVYKPLEDLSGWQITAHGICSVAREVEFDVASYAIRAPGREVEQWHQPLLRSLQEQACGLMFQHRQGVLKAFLRLSPEPGFQGQAEFGPSYLTDGLNPRWVEELWADESLRPLLCIRQSDEGGRFMRAITRYTLHFLDATTKLPDSSGGEWVDIGELEALCQIPGVLTNEARSVVSLLLSLA